MKVKCIKTLEDESKLFVFGWQYEEGNIYDAAPSKINDGWEFNSGACYEYLS